MRGVVMSETLKLLLAIFTLIVFVLVLIFLSQKGGEWLDQLKETLTFSWLFQ